MPPPSLWPPSPASAGYLPLCPPAQVEEHCQWRLLSSFLPFLGPFVNKHQRFCKKQHLKTKVSQLQLKTALENEAGLSYIVPGLSVV